MHRSDTILFVPIDRLYLRDLRVNKKNLTEHDIRSKFITPALQAAGWDLMSQIREEVYFTNGRIIVRGKLVTRGKRKFADYVLYYRPNIPIALIEAKDNNHSSGDGMQQALEYAETLDIPFVFTSNGDGFVFHDRTGQSSPRESGLALDAFPSPAQLWSRYRANKGLFTADEPLVLRDYHDDGSGKEPRYYQRIAINRTVEAIAHGQPRILLVMATGTGKTYTAFQIIWRLWKAGVKKRILFLADRNVLVEQTMANDFRPFGPAMARLSTHSRTIERQDGTSAKLVTALDRNPRRIDTSYEIYLALYQAITGPDDSQKVYRELSPGFFDLIVIDECHRGSASADSAWREILTYFSSATQIGLTATPKDNHYDDSNLEYFGPPVYRYTLKQGIRDGFLAPYKVVRVHLDIDIDGYRPAQGETDLHGHEIEERLYNQKDYDRSLVIDARTKAVAAKITQYLHESGDPYQKTIIFCVDTEHAARMRQALVNKNEDLVAENSKYVMRITGDDPEGKAQLDNFIDPESRYPVLVTTSRLLSTGVDAQTCRLIVLDREVESMTEFKQIVGRGTRVHEDTKKYYFTLIDFRQASNKFADPDFDGNPPIIHTPTDDGPIYPPDTPPTTTDVPDTGEDLPPPPQPGEDEVIVDQPLPDPVPPDVSIDDDDGPSPRPRRYYIQGNEVSIVAERIQFLDENGRLVTETLRDYSRRTVRGRFATLDQFLLRWNAADRKQAVIDELAAEGLILEPLADEVGKDLDPFDLICHIAFDRPPLTRRQRAANVRSRNVFAKYGEQARNVLNALIAKYENESVRDLADPQLLKVRPFDHMGTPIQLINHFGGRDQFLAAVHELEAALYAA